MAIPFEVVIVNPEGTRLWRITSDELEKHPHEALEAQTEEMNSKHIASMHIPFADLKKRAAVPGSAGFFGTYYVNLHVIMGSGK